MMDRLLRALIRFVNTPMIVVVAEYNNDENGDDVPEDTPDREWPKSIYGPFVSFDEADWWMNEVYPDDDTDIYDMYSTRTKFPRGWVLNDPIEFAKEYLS